LLYGVSPPRLRFHSLSLTQKPKVEWKRVLLDR
jgi:hypothetical protein